MYDSVLIPTDGSEMVDTTLEHGLRIARDHDATVHALYVVDSRVARAAEDAREDVEASLHAEGEKATEHVRARAEDAGVETVCEIRTGTPQKEIVEYTEEAGIDLIAIGTHGKSPREKLLSMGSVTERVVDSAPVPVLVVRD
ncbi:universal stress protein [Halalkalicoccus jeotgali]|uniref:UspA domain protein n=1 Tax=Halalkalicoccus jeotgali (strain DSM 18796 / CECT 7217 / JCM 14584 / KCTC 4019 / B3) TaxID=795797 RepID=D8J2M8_HALJB|nr:universal stress protein [Halalkalicoccus jeotgali]ADJ14985.1 UspA domain protein [Halalkalicoccus jeotgali B3]ELY34999.1 UspA domain-containing protein [Halalkalicoccus jeotgali B3]